MAINHKGTCKSKVATVRSAVEGGSTVPQDFQIENHVIARKIWGGVGESSLRKSHLSLVLK